MTSQNILIRNAISPFIKEKNAILDIGCRYGNKLFPFEGIGFKELLGIDINEEFEKWTYKAYIDYKKGYLKHITLSTGDKLEFEKLPWSKAVKYVPQYLEDFKSNFTFRFGEEYNVEFFKLVGNYYDVILAVNILQFIAPSNLKNVVLKIVNSLKIDGVFFIAVRTLEKSLEFEKNKWLNAEKFNRLDKTTFELRKDNGNVIDYKIHFFDSERLGILKRLAPNCEVIEISSDIGFMVGDMFLLKRIK